MQNFHRIVYKSLFKRNNKYSHKPFIMARKTILNWFDIFVKMPYNRHSILCGTTNPISVAFYVEANSAVAAIESEADKTTSHKSLINS